jgi:hypothetical protein
LASPRSPAITVTVVVRPCSSRSTCLGIDSRHNIEKWGSANLLARGKLSQI